MILIAPHWPRRHWYTKILELLIACPIMLPVIPDLLYQPKSLINHPNPELFKLTAWFLSTDSLKREVFSEQTRKLLCASWRKGTQKDYVSKFKKFSSWCDSREIDPYTANLTQVAEFLTFLYTSGLQI